MYFQEIIDYSYIKTAATIIGGVMIGVIVAYKSSDKLLYHPKPKYFYDCFAIKNNINIMDEEGDSEEKSLNSLSFFADFINGAESSLDMCFYLITDSMLINALIKAHKRKVKVRIITDYTSGICNNRFARDLFKEGILMYYDECDPGKTIMHNKFCIRDKHTLLQCSMNLTENAARGSHDNVLVTNDESFTKPFSVYYDELVENLGIKQ